MPSPPSSPRPNFSLSFQSPLPSPPVTLNVTGVNGEQVAAVTSLQFLSASPSSSHFSPAPRVLPRAAVLQEKFAPAWVIHGSQFFQEISNCSGMGPYMDCSMDICSGVVLFTCCREISALAAEVLPLPVLL